MKIINFSHPITAEQLEQIKMLTNQQNITIQYIPSHFDLQKTLQPQIFELVAQIDLSDNDILINLPALNFAAVILVFELQNKLGYIPNCLRLRPVANQAPIKFEVAEILSFVSNKSKLLDLLSNDITDKSQIQKITKLIKEFNNDL